MFGVSVTAGCAAISEPSKLIERARTVAIERLSWSPAERAGLEIMVRRDDRIDAAASGNKFYKLYHNLEQAQLAGARRIVSFGGAWSNHLHALAAVGAEQGLETVALVRGQKPAELSPTLRDCTALGMRLHFISRAEYRDKPQLLQRLKAELGDYWLVPEGGSNVEGARGCMNIAADSCARLGDNFDEILLPCATGGTLAGVAAGLTDGVLATGIVVLKGDGDLAQSVSEMTWALGNRRDNWRLLRDYHGGGYAKLSASLRKFWQVFETETGMEIEPVYGVKLWAAIADLAERGHWGRGTRLLVVHTGGLQGRRGYNFDN